jgi:hypothetical protein
MRPIVCSLTFLLLTSCAGSEPALTESNAGAGGQAGAASGASGSGGTSAGTGGQPVSAGAAGGASTTCEGDLTQLSKDCVTSFDGTAGQLPPCDTLLPLATSYWIYDCGETLSYELGSGFSSLLCAYDPHTHTLVGVLESADTTVYCDRSFTIQAGKIPPASCQGTPSSATACGAAGAAGDPPQ